MSRIRSPNYPQIGLGAAIERARLIYKAERQNRISRDTAVKLMGFGGYNGASAGVLSAVLKFGLLEGQGEEMRVSDLAVRILVPHDDDEKAEAIREAAANPPLFVEMAERWPNDPPSDHSLRAYLTRRGFADSALEAVIKSYWDTASLVRDAGPQYDPAPAADEGQDEVDEQTQDRGAERPLAPPPPPPSPAQGPGLNLTRTEAGYIVQLSGAVLTQKHVDEVVTLLTALKASMPADTPEAAAPTEH